MSHDPLSATLPPDPLVGTTIDGRYVVEGLLGEGGMGLVYRGRHATLGKALAIKVLRAEVSRDAHVMARFKQEAQSATAIGNEHIVDVSDFGSLPDGSTYFVMEFLDGASLTKVIERDAPMQLTRLLHVLEQLTDALGAAHGAGIVHRDLKPDNIFLVRRGSDPEFVKVLDFGIARVGGSSSKLTQAGQVFGTPHYMAPEQCQGLPVDARADLYALGVIAYEMAVGKPPFDSPTMLGLITAHLTDTPDVPSTHVPELPAEFDAIVARCLAKTPDARFADCAELGREVRALRAALLADHRISGMVDSERARASSALPHSIPPRGTVDTVASSGVSKGSVPVGVAVGAGLAGVGVALFGTVAFLLLRPPAPPASRSAPSITVGSRPESPASASAGPSAAPSEPRADSRVLILLESEPTGVEVLRDGELVGMTPVQVPRPAAGDRLELMLRYDGYDDYAVTLSDATLSERLHFTLRRTSGAARTSNRSSQSSAAGPTGASAPSRVEPAPMPRRRRGSEVINPWGN